MRTYPRFRAFSLGWVPVAVTDRNGSSIELGPNGSIRRLARGSLTWAPLYPLRREAASKYLIACCWPQNHDPLLPRNATCPP